MTEMTELEEMVENFAFFDDWTDRYRYLIDLGRGLPALEDAAKVEDNKVRGCQSQVWLVTEYDQGEDLMAFKADSDAAIVRGLIAILLAFYSGKSPEAVVKGDIDEVFKRIGLDHHLSPSRRNGFFSMVNKMKAAAVQQIAAARADA